MIVIIAPLMPNAMRMRSSIIIVVLRILKCKLSLSISIINLISIRKYSGTNTLKNNIKSSINFFIYLVWVKLVKNILKLFFGVGIIGQDLEYI